MARFGIRDSESDDGGLVSAEGKRNRLGFIFESGLVSNVTYIVDHSEVVLRVQIQVLTSEWPLATFLQPIVFGFIWTPLAVRRFGRLPSPDFIKSSVHQDRPKIH